MNKQELIKTLAEKAGLTEAKAEAFTNAFVETITDALSEGDKVQLVGFGTFETRQRNARFARNPQTGERISVEGKTVPAFKPGKLFKERINN